MLYFYLDTQGTKIATFSDSSYEAKKNAWHSILFMTETVTNMSTLDTNMSTEENHPTAR